MVKTQVHDCLQRANVDFETVPGLQNIFEEDNEAKNPFNNLDTESKRLSYYKEQFEFKVHDNVHDNVHDLLFEFNK